MSGSTAAIAWIGDPDSPRQGTWGAPAQLTVPLDDRGLLLGEGVFETVLVQDGQPRLLGEHLARWRQGAQLLGLPAPPPAAPLQALLAEAIARSGIASGALRLNWSRGSAPGRGLAPTPAALERPRFWLQLNAATPQFSAVRVRISDWERRNPASRLSRCKSFGYGPQLLARREAWQAGADDALLLATTGELSCGSVANLLLRQAGRWLTPPLGSGCLPGVMRGRALALGWAEERSLQPGDLARAEAALLINSLSCRPIHHCEPLALPAVPPAAAERLWRALLKGEPPQPGNGG